MGQDNSEPKNDNHIGALEALLFAYGEPMSEERAAKILGVSKSELTAIAMALAETLETSGRGATLLQHAGLLQIATHPNHAPLVERLFKEEFKEELTPAAQETLAIVAYGGPITRSIIDYIRGVNSSFILRSLSVRGLILRTPVPDRQNVYQYQVSFDFLKHLGLGRVEDFPDYIRLRATLEGLRSAPHQGSVEATPIPPVNP